MRRTQPRGSDAVSEDARMKVYVVEVGCYDSRGIGGVYTTPEAAMAAHPVPNRPVARSGEREGGWQPDGEGRWHNGLDWDAAASIIEWELDT